MESFVAKLHLYHVVRVDYYKKILLKNFKHIFLKTAFFKTMYNIIFIIFIRVTWKFYTIFFSINSAKKYVGFFRNIENFFTINIFIQKF